MILFLKSLQITFYNFFLLQLLVSVLKTFVFLLQLSILILHFFCTHVVLMFLRKFLYFSLQHFDLFLHFLSFCIPYRCKFRTARSRLSFVFNSILLGSFFFDSIFFIFLPLILGLCL